MNIIKAGRLLPRKLRAQKIVQCESNLEENLVPGKYFSSNMSPPYERFCCRNPMHHKHHSGYYFCRMLFLFSNMKRWKFFENEEDTAHYHRLEAKHCRQMREQMINNSSLKYFDWNVKSIENCLLTQAFFH